MTPPLEEPELGQHMRFTVGKRDYQLEWRDDVWLLVLIGTDFHRPLGTVRKAATGYQYRELRGFQRERFERPTFDQLMDFAL